MKTADDELHTVDPHIDLPEFPAMNFPYEFPNVGCFFEHLARSSIL